MEFCIQRGICTAPHHFQYGTPPPPSPKPHWRQNSTNRWCHRSVCPVLTIDVVYVSMHYLLHRRRNIIFLKKFLNYQNYRERRRNASKITFVSLSRNKWFCVIFLLQNCLNDWFNTRQKCGLIRLFWPKNFLQKKPKYLATFWAIFQQGTVLSKNRCGHILGNFGSNWANLYPIILSHCKTYKILVLSCSRKTACWGPGGIMLTCPWLPLKSAMNVDYAQ